MATLITVELPAVYLDPVSLDTASRFALINRNPEPNEVDVPIASPTLEVGIVTTVSAGTLVLGKINVYVNGVHAYGSSAYQSGFSGTVDTSIANLFKFAFTRAAAFDSEELVSMRVTISDPAHPPYLDETYTFTTVDVTAPRIVAVTAVGHRTVRVTYDEDVTETDAAFLESALRAENYAIVPVTVPAMPATVIGALPITSRTVELTLDTELTQGAEYALFVDDVEDVAGNAIVAPFNSGTFFGYACARPADRQFSMWAMLPVKNRRDDLLGTGDLQKFITCLQEIVDLLLCDIDAFANILDPDLADEQFVDAMLFDLGNPFNFDLSLADKRRLIRILVPLYKQKGTEVGIKNAVRFFLGLEVAVVPYTADTMSLGESELGIDWILGPAGSFALYAFDVTVTTAMTAEQRLRLRALVDYMKPAHTHFVHLIEPIIPLVIDHLELGLSALGDTWVLH